MDKLYHQNVFHHPPNTVFCKTFRKGHLVDDEEHQPIHLGEAKTVKVIHRKEEKIPPLNVEGLKHYSRPVLLSLDVMGKKYQRGQSKTNQKTKNASYFLINPEQNMPCQNFHKSSNHTIKKFSIFPQILHDELSSSHNPLKASNLTENESFEKKKRSTKNTHCKILLARNNHFPFIGLNPHNHKVSDCMIAKRPIEDMMNPFGLDISRIDEKEEPVSPLFISKESLQEIVIF